MTTHCASVAAGTLSAGQIPCNSVSPSTVTTSDAVGGAGTRRGVVCFLHPTQNSDLKMPFAVPNNIGTNFQSLQTSVNSDSWVFDYPAYPVDWSVGGVGTFPSLYNMTNADSGHGTALVNVLMTWWDHYLAYLRSRYNLAPKVVVGGFSMGAWLSFLIAINRTSTILGMFAHCPPTIWANVAISGLNMSAVNWTGMNLSTTCLSTVMLPTLVGYSTTDGVVGYSAASSPVSNTDAIITNAQGAGQNCTRYSSSTDAGTAYPNGHLYLPGDATQHQTWITSTIDPLAPANAF